MLAGARPSSSPHRSRHHAATIGPQTPVLSRQPRSAQNTTSSLVAAGGRCTVISARRRVNDRRADLRGISDRRCCHGAGRCSRAGPGSRTGAQSVPSLVAVVDIAAGGTVGSFGLLEPPCDDGLPACARGSSRSGIRSSPGWLVGGHPMASAPIGEFANYEARRPRSDARTLGRSDARTLGRSDARTLGRSDARTLGRSDARDSAATHETMRRVRYLGLGTATEQHNTGGIASGSPSPRFTAECGSGRRGRFGDWYAAREVTGSPMVQVQVGADSGSEVAVMPHPRGGRATRAGGERSSDSTSLGLCPDTGCVVTLHDRGRVGLHYLPPIEGVDNRGHQQNAVIKRASSLDYVLIVASRLAAR